MKGTTLNQIKEFQEIKDEVSQTKRRTQKTDNDWEW